MWGAYTGSFTRFGVTVKCSTIGRSNNNIERGSIVVLMADWFNPQAHRIKEFNFETFNAVIHLYMVFLFDGKHNSCHVVNK